MDRAHINPVNVSAQAPHMLPENHHKTSRCMGGGRRQEIKITLSYFNPGNPHMRSLAALTFTHQSRRLGWGVLWCRVFRERTRPFESQWRYFFLPKKKGNRRGRRAGGREGGIAVHDEGEPRASRVGVSSAMRWRRRSRVLQRKGTEANKVAALWITARGEAISGDLGGYLCIKSRS